MKKIAFAFTKLRKSIIKGRFRFAFTLIELLVVIVIIGILATISVAQFNNYQAMARDAKKIVYINQLQKALQLYAIEEETYHLPCAGYHSVGVDPCTKTQSSGFVGFGNDSATNPPSYTTSIAKFLNDRGSLGSATYATLTSTQYADKYMYYHNDNGYSFSVKLEKPLADYAVNGKWYDLEGTMANPSVTDIGRMQTIHNGTQKDEPTTDNGVYTRYLMNYAVGIVR